MIAKNVFPTSTSTLPVSRQRPNESKLIENMLIEDFLLKRRNGAKKYSNLSFKEGTYIYTYDRGDNKETYLIAISYKDIDAQTRQGIVYILDREGNQKNLNYRAFGNSDTDLDLYLQFPSDKTPQEVFKCETIRDTTFIINRTKQVKMKPLDINYPLLYNRKRLVWVKEATNIDGGYTYFIIENKQTYWTRRTDTLKVVEDFNLIPNTSKYGSVLAMLKGAETYTRVEDSHGNKALKLVYREVERMEDLPQDFDNSSYKWFYYEKNDGEPYYEIYEWTNTISDYILSEVTRSEPDISLGGEKLTPPNKLPPPDNRQTISSYCMVKITENGSGYYVEHDRGKWIECPEPTDEREIDNRTMPLTLYRTSLNDFSLSFMELKRKHATAPHPPFINSYIQDVVYYNGRLGFVTSDSVSLSAIIEDEAINFFYTTARAEFPSDPMFYGMSLSKRENILKVGTYQYGLFVFTTNGIYINRLVGDNGESTNYIVKVSELNISQAIVSQSVVYYLADNRLYLTAPDGTSKEVSQNFRDWIKGAKDIATYPERGYLFLLDSTQNNIIVIKDGGVYIWNIGVRVYAIEVQEAKLIIVGVDGVYAIDLLEDTNGYKDDNRDFISRVYLPKNLLGEGKTWLKFWYKRLELFITQGDYKIKIERETDSYIINSLPTPYPNKQHVINGHNFNTDIIIESVEDKPLDIELINLTLEVEPQPKRG